MADLVRSNPLRTDQTRLATLRRKFANALRLRYKLISRSIRKLIVTDDVFWLTSVQNTRWANLPTSQQLTQFSNWLAAEFARTLTNPDPFGESLWKDYIEEAFEKGASRTYSEVKRKIRAANLGQKTGDYYRGTKDEFMRNLIHSSVNIEEIRGLVTRVDTALQSISDELTASLTRITADGLLKSRNGFTPAQLNAELIKQLGTANHKATRVVQTEITRAHAHGQLTAMQSLKVGKVTLKAEWVTAKDPCPLCSGQAGTVMSLEAAWGVLPLHPYCQCAWAVVAG